MSAPVTSVSVDIPSGVISPAARLDGGAAADTPFDALFDAFEPLVGAGANQAQAIPPTGETSGQEQATKPVPNVSGNPGAWFAQIHCSLNERGEALSTIGFDVAGSATASGGSSSVQIAVSQATGTRGQETAENAAGEKMQQPNEKPRSASIGAVLQNFLGAAVQRTVSQPKDDHNTPPKSDNPDTSDNEKEIPISVFENLQGTRDWDASSQSVVEGAGDYLSGLASDPNSQTTPSLSAAALPGALCSIRLNTAESKQAGAETQRDAKNSQAWSNGTAFAQIAQLESALSLTGSPHNALQSLSDRASSSDVDPKAIGLDANERAQVPGQAELGKHVSAQIDRTLPPMLGGDTDPATAKSTPAVAAQITASFEGSKVAAARVTSNNSSSGTASTALEKADDVIRPLMGGQPLPVHRNDAGVFASLVDTSGQISAPNSDAPVRVAFSVAPNSLEQSAFDAFALRIATKSSDGERNFSIRLDPPELGRVEVSLSVSSAGHAQAEIAADKAQTLDLLQRDAPALERALKDAGLNLAGGFAFSLKGEGKSGGSWRDLQHGARGRDLKITADAPTGNASLSGTASLAARAYGLATARLDIRV